MKALSLWLVSVSLPLACGPRYQRPTAPPAPPIASPRCADVPASPDWCVAQIWQPYNRMGGQLAVMPDGKRVVVASGDTPYLSDDSGATYRPYGPNPHWPQLNGVARLGEVLIGANYHSNIGLSMSKDGGATWGYWRAEYVSGKAYDSRIYETGNPSNVTALVVVGDKVYAAARDGVAMWPGKGGGWQWAADLQHAGVLATNGRLLAVRAPNAVLLLDLTGSPVRTIKLDGEPFVLGFHGDTLCLRFSSYKPLVCGNIAGDTPPTWKAVEGLPHGAERYSYPHIHGMYSVGDETYLCARGGLFVTTDPLAGWKQVEAVTDREVIAVTASDKHLFVLAHAREGPWTHVWRRAR